MLGGGPFNVNIKCKKRLSIPRSRDLSLPDEPIAATGIRFEDSNPRSPLHIDSLKTGAGIICHKQLDALHWGVTDPWFCESHFAQFRGFLSFGMSQSNPPFVHTSQLGLPGCWRRFGYSHSAETFAAWSASSPSQLEMGLLTSRTRVSVRARGFAMTTEYHRPSRQRAEPAPLDSASTNFANASEAEFARILDFYHIAWQYEPRAFAIAWDEAGNITSSFTPDFYLPEHDLYIELTTLRQPLVTRKNRKIRRLRELYPEVNLKVFYGADYRKLLEKFAGSGAWQEEPVGNDDKS